MTDDQRVMSVICVRNCLRRRWSSRNRAVVAVGDDEKAVVRHAALELSGSHDRSLGTQLGILVADIARLDWPAQWPTLFPAIVAHIRDAASGVSAMGAAGTTAALGAVDRWLAVMVKVVEELVSKRTPAHQRQYREASVDVGRVVTAVYLQLMTLVRAAARCASHRVASRGGVLSVEAYTSADTGAASSLCRYSTSGRGTSTRAAAASTARSQGSGSWHRRTTSVTCA
jgi:hypothetical protein